MLPLAADFTGQTVALGIAGGIAAYRACDLIRELYRRGAKRVPVLMTPSAAEFVSPLTLSMLAQEPVYTDPLALNILGNPVHISVAQEADALLILPATANIMAKLAHGLADDLLSTTALTFTHKPVLLAPAMNTRMWDHPATQANLKLLDSFGNVTVISPQAGLLACGETGNGHLADQTLVLQALAKALHPNAGQFAGIKALVTAGGTIEPIDPVRHIGNRSSGKMGLAIADELHAMGARVTLLWAGVNPEPPLRAYTIEPLRQVHELQGKLRQHFLQSDLLVMAAAVSDFKLVEPSNHKLKREPVEEELTLHLSSQPDLLAECGARKQKGQVLVGFAAESQALLDNAQAKLVRKQLDMMVANDISRADIGFDATDNEVTLLFANGQRQHLPQQSKIRIARQLLLAVRPLLG